MSDWHCIAISLSQYFMYFAFSRFFPDRLQTIFDWTLNGGHAIAIAIVMSTNLTCLTCLNDMTSQWRSKVSISGWCDTWNRSDISSMWHFKSRLQNRWNMNSHCDLDIDCNPNLFYKCIDRYFFTFFFVKCIDSHRLKIQGG